MALLIKENIVEDGYLPQGKNDIQYINKAEIKGCVM
jgi:hypothetical protein